MSCNHKIPRDHQMGKIGDRVNWVCSHCKKESVWTDQHSSFGSIECLTCGFPEMHWVACSDKCAVALGGKAMAK